MDGGRDGWMETLWGKTKANAVNIPSYQSLYVPSIELSIAVQYILSTAVQ